MKNVSATKKKAVSAVARKKPAARESAKEPTNPARVRTIVDRLAEHYPNAVCALHHKNAWQLMVATILSAQCTDVRVNMVTPELFRRFPTPADDGEGVPGGRGRVDSEHRIFSQ